MRHALVLTLLLLGGCAATSGSLDGEPVLAADHEEPWFDGDDAEPGMPGPEEEAGITDGDEDQSLLFSIADSVWIEQPRLQELEEVLVTIPTRQQEIHNLVVEAQAMLREVELQYVFTGKGKKEKLRGRPVAFALWNEQEGEWTIAHLEIPPPPVKWKPGGKPLAFKLITPGIEARHVKGTGAERLMFSFSQAGQPLKVYGRKFPVFDDKLLKKKQWRAVAATARPIVYLPYTDDTSDPEFVTGGRDYLLGTARQAIRELRAAGVPSTAYPGRLLADIVPAEVITTLAVIEQTDDTEFVQNGAEAYNAVLNQYGLKRGEAYRYSVSSASAVGPMQFTNRRGNGTYALVVRRCPAARIDPDFERGATNLLNAMKAAICLFDIELGQMTADIRAAYALNMQVLGIFPVAAYNGGPKNVKKLAAVVKKAGVKLDELRPAGELEEGSKVRCPCLWKESSAAIVPVALPRYNNENRWYIEKYQRILGVFE